MFFGASAGGFAGCFYGGLRAYKHAISKACLAMSSRYDPVSQLFKSSEEWAGMLKRCSAKFRRGLYSGLGCARQSDLGSTGIRLAHAHPCPCVLVVKIGRALHFFFFFFFFFFKKIFPFKHPN